MQSSSCSFSVEQVELIRRLRNSGISCQQLIEAFQALERIDSQFGNIYNNPALNDLQQAKLVAALGNPPLSGNDTGISTSTSGPISPRSSSAATSSLHGLSILQSSRLAGNSAVSHKSLVSPGAHSVTQRSTDPSIQASSSLVIPNFADVLRDLSSKAYSATHNGHLEASSLNESDNSNTSHNGPGPSSGHTRSQAADLTPDQCLILVQCSSEDKVIDFVKKCLLSAEFKPLQQAQDLGVSDSAMQAFLWGDVFSIEQSSRRKLLEWIIGMCHHSEWFTTEMTKLLHLQGYGDGFDVQFTPRRERFTFREKHLDVLEAFWRKKQYPTFEEKEHIADECNYAMAMEVQRTLDEKEKVTPVNVANWFKNKRKEIKRVTKKGDSASETVKTFLDRLNPKGAGELTSEQVLLQQKLLNQAGVSYTTSSQKTAAGTGDVPSNPDSSSGSSSAALSSILTKSELADPALQVVFPSYSNLAASYPGSLSGSSLQIAASTGAVMSATATVTNNSSSLSQNQKGLVALSPDSSSATHSLKRTDSTPTVTSLLSAPLFVNSARAESGGLMDPNRSSIKMEPAPVEQESKDLFTQA